MLHKVEGDIIVLGAGVVGLTFAMLAAQQGFKVLLVEAKKIPEQAENPLHDPRAFAISRSSQHLFEQLTLWQSLLKLGGVPYQYMRVWDALGYGEITFAAETVSEPDLGHIVENQVMTQVLLQAALDNPNILLYAPNTPMSLSQEQDKVSVILDKGLKLTAKLCVGADGANSWLRKAAGIEITFKDYQQSALVTTVVTEQEHNSTAWQRFLPEGPLAFLPLRPSNTSALVWTAATTTIENLTLCQEAAFCEELGYQFDFRLGKIQSAGPRWHFPLTRQHAKKYLKNRIVLIGDAAHVIHPLAGQGVNLGLGDVAALVALLAEAKAHYGDLANLLMLRKYERQRKSAVTKVMASMDLLNTLFGSRTTAAIGLRSLGLNFINGCTGLKKKWIAEAMGLRNNTLF
jgi:2-octaprenylphenol hydroxylase